jgi:hypothetical protein
MYDSKYFFSIKIIKQSRDFFFRDVNYQKNT